jgi:signal transduction histidine kinase
LRVAYEGRGFTSFRGRYTLATLTKKALGPRTLKERVWSAGGELTIDSDERGARLEILLPLTVRPAELGHARQ